MSPPTRNDAGDAGRDASTVVCGLSEGELSALVAVCVAVGTVVVASPGPLGTRLATLAVALFVTVGLFVPVLKRLR